MAGNTDPMSYEQYIESLSAPDRAVLEYRKKLQAATDEQLNDPRLLRDAPTYHFADEVVIERTRRSDTAKYLPFVNSETGRVTTDSLPGMTRLMTPEETLEYNKKANPEDAAQTEQHKSEQANQDLDPIVEDQSRPGESATIQG